MNDLTPEAAPENKQVEERKEGRLQRPADFTGQQIQTFRAVFLRHGLPCALLGLVFLADPSIWPLLQSATAAAAQNISLYALGAGALFLGLVAHAAIGRYPLNVRRVSWIAYLGCLSLWEEWVFRIGIPHYLTALGLGLLAPILFSNALFGLLHYFTLRWRWQWCLMAGVGGLFFSHHFATHHNLLFIAGIHWVATYLNTPRPPRGYNRLDDKSENQALV